MAQTPWDWVDMKPTAGGHLRRNDDHLPGLLGWLVIAGVGGLLLYPLVTAVSVATHSPIWNGWLALLLGPAVAFLSFIAIGAGFEVTGSVLRGALVAAALYVLVGVVFTGALLLRVGAPLLDLGMLAQLIAGWPLWTLQLLGVFGLSID